MDSQVRVAQSLALSLFVLTMTSLNIPSGKESEDLPYLYWIPKLHKTPYKETYIGYHSTYFSNKIQKGKPCYSEEQVMSMLEFLIDNIFVSFGGTLFQQVVGIPMGTNCALLLADSFLYSYQSEFLQKFVEDQRIHEARAFNFTYRYIDDVLSINTYRFAEFLPLIYPPELEVKETTDTASSASFLDLYLEFDDSGQLSTKIYNNKFSKYVQQYTSFSCIWCLHFAIDSLCKGQQQLF